MKKIEFVLKELTRYQKDKQNKKKERRYTEKIKNCKRELEYLNK